MARRLAVPALALLTAAVVAGCGGLFRSYDVTPSGLTRYDDGLRRLLVQARYDSALVVVSGGRSHIGDELLQLQYEGLVAHYAGRWKESNAALQRADAMAEDRYTRSLSRAALSLITNDRILPYRPPTTERLLIHYYGTLNYLRLGDPESAAVEARRLSQLLDLDGTRASGEFEATLRYLAGAAFEAAGERNDAAVAYRLAARARGEARSAAEGDASDTVVEARAGEGGATEAASGASGGDAGLDGSDESLWSLAERALEGGASLPPDSGEVILLVERGFVPHRVARSVNVLLWPSEVRTLRAASVSPADELSAPAAALAALLVAERSAGGDLSDRPAPGVPGLPHLPLPFQAPQRGSGAPLPGGGQELLSTQGRAASDSVTVSSIGRPYLLRVSWPELAGGLTAPPLRLRLEGEVSRPLPLRTDVAASVAADFNRQQPLLVAKALGRALAKYAVAQRLEERLKDEDETLGEIAGVMANVGLSLLEQADTRSWHLVPAEISIVRLRLPAGTQPLSLELPAQGLRTGRALEAGEIDVPAGGLTVVSVRPWR